MIKMTAKTKKDLQKASGKLAAAGAPLFHEGDPKKIKAKADKRAADRKQASRKNK